MWISVLLSCFGVMIYIVCWILFIGCLVFLNKDGDLKYDNVRIFFCIWG